jgi:leucyl-tRNA synthetase
VRGTVSVPNGLTDEALKTAAINSEVGQRFLKSKEIIRVIIVPNRKLINFVIK